MCTRVHNVTNICNFNIATFIQKCLCLRVERENHLLDFQGHGIKPWHECCALSSGMFKIRSMLQFQKIIFFQP